MPSPAMYIIAGRQRASGPAPEAHRTLQRLEFHDTPKHASWLNMVEIEIGLLRGRCLDRRMGELLSSEIDKGHIYWVGECSGTFFNDKGSLFDKAAVKCPAHNDIDTIKKRTASPVIASSQTLMAVALDQKVAHGCDRGDWLLLHQPMTGPRNHAFSDVCSSRAHDHRHR